MKGFEFYAELIRHQKVDHCFGLLGDANMQFASKLVDLGVQFTYVQHEHCAIAASMAYARKTGKIGISTVTCGPGLTQIMTALPAAVRAGIPLIILAGESPLNKSWYNQQIDQAPFVKATGAQYFAIHTTARFKEGINEAFLTAVRDSIPVVVGVPFDLFHQNVTAPETQTGPALWEQCQINKRGPAPCKEDLDSIVSALKSAKRPIILAGLGANDKKTALLIEELSEKADALLTTTLPARGLFNTNPFYLGISGGFSSEITRKKLANSDLILSIGASLTSHNTDQGTLWPQARVIQVTMNPQYFYQGRSVAHQIICADAHQTVLKLLNTMETKSVHNRTESTREEIAISEPDSSASQKYNDGLNPSVAAKHLNRGIPNDWQLVNSSGHCSYYFSHMKNRPYPKFLTIREFGAIGNGLSFAMGVAVATREPTVLFDGDGSFLMHVQELETIRRDKLPIISCIFNDGGYGSEFHKLRSEGLRDDGANFGFTNLARIADGFNIENYQINTIEELDQALESLVRAPQAAVLDIRISQKAISPVIQRSHGVHSKTTKLQK